MSSMSCTRLTLFTLTALTFQIVGLIVFVLGFFPVKPALSGVGGPESFRSPICDSVDDQNETAIPSDQLRSLYQELSGIPPSFDRLILMVIDGLPAEFVLGKNGHSVRKDLKDAMPYTQSLLANGMAIGYHAKAAPPTVTMPRLKAMVSGAIGGFLDVAFNFNTQALLDDNLLDQFFRIGWKMVMLGDETWLKLFPGLFTRQDGVSSFFVKDTVQVDQNVTRHVSVELNRNDWNLLILHYLGLDHIGHIGGRHSMLMGPKLAEMDEVVKMIHLSMIQARESGRGQTLLMIASDHGMTENGNHGGSSEEETDSLVLLVGLDNRSEYASATNNVAYQVDITPTLALLFGVPIPKNNVGVFISEASESLKDDQQLRALELNSWQLLRLLQAQLPVLSHGRYKCNGFGDGDCNGFGYDEAAAISECSGDTEEQLCCLYVNAAINHSLWRSKKGSKSNTREDFNKALAAYHKFLKTASEWLSRKTTDKPADLLSFGVAAMVLSCLLLVTLVLYLCTEVYLESKQQSLNLTNINRWCVEESFIVGAVLMLVISMGSSSMVEEEHYIWHFLSSTYYLLLLRKAMQSYTSIKGQNRRKFQVCSIFLLLTSERILKSWHRGGVNWTHLPDISKWLEQFASDKVKLIQLISVFSVINTGLYSLHLKKLKLRITWPVVFSLLISGLLVFLHVLKYQDNMLVSSSYGATISAQIVYATLGICTVGTIIALPWHMPISFQELLSSSDKYTAISAPVDIDTNSLLVAIKDSLYVIGAAYITCWCLLQLLLQQPINSVPIFLLFFQISASLVHSFYRGYHIKEWVEEAALYFLGMAGHFSLGNSNTLATIDVAGAFIGISNHSTFLSGILMFIITYAAPMLAILSMVMYISVKETNFSDANIDHLLKEMLGFPCLIPLAINSVLLTAYTIVLLLMRNHLFVWSVFSPKYLYVCAATVCTYVGVCSVAATVTYTYWVLALRWRKQTPFSYKPR